MYRRECNKYVFHFINKIEKNWCRNFSGKRNKEFNYDGEKRKKKKMERKHTIKLLL